VILGLDTDVLVSWAMAGAPHHRAARALLGSEVTERQGQLGVTPQVLFEFVHVSTDSRRFEHPLPMGRAVELALALWEADETLRVVPEAAVLPRAFALMSRLQLGRKRILDTVLAATLEAAGIRRLATLNPRDFAVFPFLEIVSLR
jgi:predicted nucleic acid-binding protein